MKKVTSGELDALRIRTGEFATEALDGNNGVFEGYVNHQHVFIIGNDGKEWEHVSLTIKNRYPNVQEVKSIRDMFWNEEEPVLQFVLPQSQSDTEGPNTVHLWRPVAIVIPKPPINLYKPKLMRLRDRF